MIKKEARCSDVTSGKRANITVTLGEDYPEIEKETVPTEYGSGLDYRFDFACLQAIPGIGQHPTTVILSEIGTAGSRK